MYKKFYILCTMEWVLIALSKNNSGGRFPAYSGKLLKSICLIKF